jgi:hypothetical protein
MAEIRPIAYTQKGSQLYQHCILANYHLNNPRRNVVKENLQNGNAIWQKSNGHLYRAILQPLQRRLQQNKKSNKTKALQGCLCTGILAIGIEIMAF